MIDEQPHVCRTCKWAVFDFKYWNGKCECPLPICVSSDPYLRSPIWRDEIKPCPTYEPKEVSE